MGRHSLWDVDVVSMAIIWMHSMGVGRWTFMCSRGMLHHPAPLNLHSLQHLMLMKPLYRSTQCWHVVRQGLMICRKVLGQRGT